MKLLTRLLSVFLLLGFGAQAQTLQSAIVHADAYAGADLGAKINAAIAALPIGPDGGVPSGVVDARGLTGIQMLSTPINCQYVQIIFGAALIAQSAPITVGQTCVIQGVGTGIGQGNNFGLTRFQQLNNSYLPAMFYVGGGQATIRDIVVDGFKSFNTSGTNLNVTGVASGSGGVCEYTIGSTAKINAASPQTVTVSGITGTGAITKCNLTGAAVVDDATHFHITGSVFGGSYSSGGAVVPANIVVAQSHVFVSNVVSQNSAGDGVQLVSSTKTVNNAAVGTFQNLVSTSNGNDGMYCFGASDTMVELSSFEFNTNVGIEFNNCPTMRLTNFDVGGNKIGVWMYGQAWPDGIGSQGNIFSNGQFGNQSQQDVLIDGANAPDPTKSGSWGNQFTGVQFPGGLFRINNSGPMVEIKNSNYGGNIISGSAFWSIVPCQDNPCKANSIGPPSYAVYVHDSKAIDTLDFTSIGTYGTSILKVPAWTRVNICDTTANTCTQSMTGNTSITGNLTVTGATTTQTPGANAADASALNIVNPSTMASASVQATWADGTGALGSVVAKRHNLASDASLYFRTSNRHGALTDAMQISPDQRINALAAPFGLKGFTVGNLPHGVVGDLAYVTDQKTSCPADGGAFTGGGSVKCLAFYNGSGWIKP